MDFKQMFDTEGPSSVPNAFYESGVNNDMLALVNEANKTVNLAVKTPNGLTQTSTIHNKVLKGDVLSPLVFSNMVNVNITKLAISTGNIYIFKNKVAIPPLLMQDDTLAISTCGYKTKQKMNSFLNTRKNIMNLQFGRDTCVKMIIGKKHNIDNVVMFL